MRGEGGRVRARAKNRESKVGGRVGVGGTRESKVGVKADNVGADW